MVQYLTAPIARVWPLEPPQLAAVPFDVPRHVIVSLSTSLRSGTTRCSRPILRLTCPSPRISHFCNEPWLLLSGMVLKTKMLGRASGFVIECAAKWEPLSTLQWFTTLPAREKHMDVGCSWWVVPVSRGLPTCSTLPHTHHRDPAGIHQTGYAVSGEFFSLH